MLKKFALITVLFTLSHAAHAIQNGFSLSLTAGTIDFEDDSSNLEADADVQSFFLGYSLATMSERVFSYRLQAGLEFAAVELTRISAPGFGAADIDFDIDSLLVGVTNTFAFRVTPHQDTGAMFWLGPSVSLSAGTFEDEDNDDGSVVLFGIGPSLGLDIASSGGVTSSIELSYRLSFGEYDYDDDQFSDIDAEQEELQLRFSMLFGK